MTGEHEVSMHIAACSRACVAPNLDEKEVCFLSKGKLPLGSWTAALWLHTRADAHQTRNELCSA